MNQNVKATLQATLENALNEDLGTGDITSHLLPNDAMMTAHFVAKANGIIAGLDVAERVFALVDSDVIFQRVSADSHPIKSGETIATVHGKARSILTAERTALNFMQRMSGIATLTSRFVTAVSGTNATILDTRKTVPGLRHLDKWAVEIGGGKNHRIGLYDMILIKENHIAAAGSIPAVLTQAQAITRESGIPIEIEVTNLDELRQALPFNITRIMLDNMSLAEMREAVAITNGQTALEASGNVNLDTVRAIAETGVDYISSGALTHSVTAFDISLLAV